MISVVVPWRDRIELKNALPSLVREIASLEGDLTIVNFGGSEALLDEQIQEWKEHLSVISIATSGFFNKPKALNCGAKLTSKPFLFFCDCDIILEDNVLKELAEQLNSRPGAFATLVGVRESIPNSRGGRHVACFGYELYIRTIHDTEVRIVDNEEDAKDGTRHAPGLLLVRRNHFEQVNGYNSALDGWGWEDQDMICRLSLGAALTRIRHGKATHISHDDHARVSAYPHKDRWESRDKMFRRALARYDEGNFLGTYTQDAAELLTSQCVTY
jgi:predicted glycosyltransferase involved in capsule biosynthesis